MLTRQRLNLILFVVITILLLVVVMQPSKKNEPQYLLLTQLEQNKVTHIKITRKDDNQDIELEKTKRGWRMLKPYSFAANSFRIDSVLKLLTTASYTQNNLKGLNLATFGLDKPYATITFNHTTSLVFGHNKTLQHHRYIKIGNTLHLTQDTFYYQLIAKAESFISHKLIPAQKQINKLVLPNLTLTKQQGQWQITPQPKHFSSDNLTQLINEWQLSQAYDIRSAMPLNNIKADIQIYFADKTHINFNLIKDKNDFILQQQDTGLQYILSLDRKDKLLQRNNGTNTLDENKE